MYKCLNCRSKFKFRSNKKFCSVSCRARYNSKRAYKGEAYVPWRKKNPEGYRKAMKRAYEKNKVKFKSRSYTYLTLICNKINMDKFCKNCKSKDNLEIHHKVYPTKIKELQKAINEGKIYMLCKKCHGVVTNK